MKNRILLAIITCALLLSGCSYKNSLVKTIQIDATTQKITYRNPAGSPIRSDSAHAKEGTNIDISVQNYNPLTQTVTVNPIQSIINYQNPISLTTNFFPIPSAATQPSGTNTPTVGAPAALELKGRNVKKPTQVTCNKDDALYKLVAGYMKFRVDYNENSKKFKMYYNALSYLNAQFNEFKLDNGLLKTCLCDYLDKFNNQVIPLYKVDHTISSSAVNPIEVKCPIDSAGCNVISYTTELTQANVVYKQYFLDVIDSLTKIDARIAAKIKGVDITKYLKDNFAGCMRDSVVVEMTDQKFKTDLSADEATFQALNKQYDAQYTKDITSNIAEYSTLVHLSFIYTQKNIQVTNSDEFKTSVVLTNSSTPTSTFTYNIDLLVTRMIKIDFSAGGFFSTLSNEAGQLSKKAGADSFKVVRYKTNNYTLGPMGYINFHSQTPTGVQWGGFLGTGLNFNQTTNIALAVGGELTLGKNQRIILHAGAAFSQVSRVASIYPDGTYFADGTYSPPTIQKWDAKIMFGLSWNLSKSQ